MYYMKRFNIGPFVMGLAIQPDWNCLRVAWRDSFSNEYVLNILHEIINSEKFFYAHLTSARILEEPAQLCDEWMQMKDN